MDMTHVHLLLNHVPTIGFGIALAMFVIALLMKNAELKRAALVLFVGVGMLTIPTYVSGNSASEVICEGGTRAPTCTDSLVSKTLIQTHEGAALLAFTAILLTAAFAWLALWQLRRTSNVEGWTTGLVLIMSLIAFGLVSRAANKRQAFLSLPPELQVKAEFGGDMMPDDPDTRRLLAQERVMTGPRGQLNLFDPEAIHRGGHASGGERHVFLLSVAARFLDTPQPPA